MTPDEMMEAYLEGTLSPDEETKLREWLEADEANLEEFARQVEIHATLGEERVPMEEGAPAPAARRSGRASRTLNRLRRREPERFPVLPLAAAAGLLALIGLLAALALSGPKPGPRRNMVVTPTPEPDTPEPRPKPAPRVVVAPRPEDPTPKPPTPKVPPAPRETSPPKPDLPEPVVDAPKQKPAPAPKPEPPVKTLPSVASLVEVRGAVHLVAGDVRTPAKAGAAILEGQGLDVAGTAVFAFADGTRVEVEPGSTLRGISAPEEQGKQLLLEAGALTAQVAKQAPRRPMSFSTPHARAVVLGTTLRLSILEEATRLDVTEGRIKFTDTRRNRSVIVTSGKYAIAGDGPLRATPLRRTDGLLALYTFREGRGTVVHDSSGRGAALHLSIRDPKAVRWTKDGLEVRAPTLIRSAGPATKILQACAASNAITIEAWITPNLAGLPPSKEPARLVTLSADAYGRNVTFEQRAPRVMGKAEMKDVYQARFGAGKTFYVTTAEGVLAARRTHVVLVRDAAGTGRIYVDGVERVRVPGGPSFANWNADYALGLAGEFKDAGPRAWFGTLHRVCIYAAAFDAERVRGHFVAGPN